MDRLRNIGIVAHIDAGKTTLTERILHDTGRQTFVGEVDEGTAAMDWMREEQERGISITAAATRVDWGGYRIHLIDTPGHVDFIAEVERCMRVLDGVVVVLDGTRGVESQTVTVWRQADRWSVPRLVFVNKLDRQGADFAGSVRMVGDRLNCRALPVVIPLEHEGWAGLADVVTGAVHWFSGQPPDEILPRLRREVSEARELLVEACAELDDAIMKAWVETRPVAATALAAAVRRGCRERSIVPVLGGSALHDLGVDLLLDAACRLLPAPDERPRSGPTAAEPPADAAAPFCGFVFKVQHADVLMNFVRVFAGTLRPGQVIRCARTGLDLPVPAVWTMHALHHEETALAEPGDVVVLPDETGLATGDTVHDPDHPVRLETLEFPEPVLAARFEPASDIDRDRLLAELRTICADDPTLAVDMDPEAGVPVVRGMGELHLEIVADRLRRRVGLGIQVGLPAVARRESVAHRGAGSAEVHATVAGVLRTARADIAVEPLEPGEEVVVEAGPDLLAAPPPLVRAALEELRGRARSGLRSPVPAGAVRMTLVALWGDAPPEEGEGLYLQAVRVALAKAVTVAEPVLLEPVATMEVSCPPDSLSAVLADLNGRGAEVRHVSSGTVGAVVQARAPLAALLGYATRLRSITRGMGVAQVQPDGFAPVPRA